MKKNLFAKLFLSFIFGVATFVTCLPVEAYYYHGGRYYRDGGYYRHGYVRTYNNYYRCRVVGGYWARGYWHAAHRVCWR